jgi:hypothetical protein
MIPQAYITAWRKKAPWQEDFQVEQDLVIERALMAIYSDEFLKERLAFRGGTALHKLHLSPAASVDAKDVPTYSFDIAQKSTFYNDNGLLSRWQGQVGLRYRF